MKGNLKTKWGDRISDNLYYKIYKNHLSKELTLKQVDFLVKKFNLKNKKILDIPCGFGRHSLELSRSGNQITGMDISPMFLKIAKNNARKIRNKPKFIQGNWFEIPYEHEFDVILNLFTSLGYSDKKDDLKVLQQFYKALKQSGVLVIDLNNAYRVTKSYSNGKITNDGSRYLRKEIGNDKKKYIREEWYRAKDHTWKIKVTSGKEYFLATVHIYTLKEITSLLNKTGFKIKKIYGDFDGSRFTKKSKRIILLCKKK